MEYKEINKSVLINLLYDYMRLYDYPVDFFKWLIKTWHIRPKEIHHTSAACNVTCFYDDSVIYHLVRDCNLELLYRIYKGEITKEQAKMERGIRYARVRVHDSLLGGKGGTVQNLNCIVCDGIVFYSAKLCFWKEDKRLEILEMYDKRPDTDFENKNLHSLSDKLIKNKTGKYHRYVKRINAIL